MGSELHTTPLDVHFSEAVRIATANGAEFVGMSNEIGTIAPGKRADLALIHGDPLTRVEDIENVEIVFNNGVGLDSRN